MITRAVTDDDFRDLIEWACCLETGPWVAGGSVRKLWTGQPWENQDVDFFFRDRQQLEDFSRGVLHLSDRVEIMIETANATTYKVHLPSGAERLLQAVRRDFYPTLAAVLDDFDFNLAQFASDGTQMVTRELALEDVRHNRLRRNPASTKKMNPLRVLKYAAYGFDPDYGLLAEAAKGINNGDIHEVGY
jgi:hypothetical protein